jgi:hypothetical protein
VNSTVAVPLITPSPATHNTVRGIELWNTG